MATNLNMKVNIAGVEFKNPVLTASGTFGNGEAHSQFIDLNRLGGITLKGVANQPWPGNPPPRVAETHGGMLNAVGLQNAGADKFKQEELPFLRNFDTKVIVNLCGKTIEEYVEVAEMLSDSASAGDIDLFELNISCPNVKAGGMAMGTDPKVAEEVTTAVKKHTKIPLIVKLSPNVTDITAIAKACEAGGADGLSLINTLIGMKIDIHRRKPVLGNTIGGLSGPAIKPVAVRMVYQVAKAVELPIIGMGGIATGEDAIEFIMAGATAISIGMANFINPTATIKILDGIIAFMDQNKINDINEIRGII